jgi:predicted AlkP superfamily pyrophosphatase or phosphodiesterase
VFIGKRSWLLVLLLALWSCAALLLCGGAPPAAPAADRSLLLISLDGLRPDYVLKADEYGVKIPNLRRIYRSGAHATGVRGVLPTVTYASHTTIVTGVWPAKHHVCSNVVFDPLGANMDGWYWYSEDIASPTIWEAAAKAGIPVGSVGWPVSVGAPGVRYLIPEFWRTQKTEDDFKLLRAVSTPGLMAEIEAKVGPYVVDPDIMIPGDIARTRYAVAILREKRTRLTTVHLISLDHMQHATGPFSPEANETLEQLDARVGELEAAARQSYPGVVICVVSDHGFARTDHSLSLMAAFLEEGLVTMEGGAGSSRPRHVVDWKAFPKVDGGSAAILLKDPKDEATRAKVEQLLRRLASNPDSGIAQILGPKEIAANGGCPYAAFWVDMRPGFSVINSEGALVRTKKVGGTHGFLASHPEMLASFFIAGPGVRSGLDLGEIDMRSVAPTVAGYLGASLPSADLKPLPVFVSAR